MSVICWLLPLPGQLGQSTVDAPDHFYCVDNNCFANGQAGPGPDGMIGSAVIICEDGWVIEQTPMLRVETVETTRPLLTEHAALYTRSVTILAARPG